MGVHHSFISCQIYIYAKLVDITNLAGTLNNFLPSSSSEFQLHNWFQELSVFSQYSTVLADKFFPEVLGESKSKVKKVALWHSYDSVYKKCKFKTTSTSHEQNKTAKGQMCKSHKGIILSQKEDLLMLCKKGLIPKQHFTFFDSPTVTTSEERKMILILTVVLTVRKMNLLIHIKMVKTYSSDFV